MNNPHTPWPSSLDDGELEELDHYLRRHARNEDLLLDGVHGLLSALAVGPLSVLPEAWLPEVLHAPFSDETEGNRVLALLAKLNDSIIAELEVDAYEPILGEIDDPENMDGFLSAAGWCEGFSRGIDLNAALWERRLSQDRQLMEYLGPVMALAVDEGVLSAETEFERLSDEEYDQCVVQIPTVLHAVHHYWQQHPPAAEDLAARQDAQVAQLPPRLRSGHSVH